MNLTQEWTVQDVRDGKVVPNPHGGELQKFYVDFIGGDGTVKADTYWRRKVGDRPEPGRSYYGTITSGKYGPMFKKEAPPQGGGTASAGGANLPSGPSTGSPFREARIVRQHSQEMSIRVLTAMGALSAPASPGDDAAAQIKEWTDYFDQDAFGAEEEPGRQAPSEPPAPAATGSDIQADLERALDAAGLTAAGGRLLVANYMLEGLSPERREVAFNKLISNETQAATLRALEQQTELHFGEALPKDVAGAEDDIPF